MSNYKFSPVDDVGDIYNHEYIDKRNGGIVTPRGTMCELRLKSIVRNQRYTDNISPGGDTIYYEYSCLPWKNKLVNERFLNTRVRVHYVDADFNDWDAGWYHLQGNTMFHDKPAWILQRAA